MQGLLLRFLETGEIQRVGSDAVETRGSTSASSPRRTATCVTASRPRRFARISTTGSTSSTCMSRRCANASRTSRLLLDHFLTMFARRVSASRVPVVRCPKRWRCCSALPVAGQRARAEERGRAAGRQEPATRRIDRRRSAAGRSRAPSGSRPRHGRRRRLAASQTRSTSRSCMATRVVLVGGLHAVHVARPDPRRPARAGRQGPRADRRAATAC